MGDLCRGSRLRCGPGASSSCPHQGVRVIAASNVIQDYCIDTVFGVQVEAQPPYIAVRFFHHQKIYTGLRKQETEDFKSFEKLLITTGNRNSRKGEGK